MFICSNSLLDSELLWKGKITHSILAIIFWQSCQFLVLKSTLLAYMEYSYTSTKKHTETSHRNTWTYQLHLTSHIIQMMHYLCPSGASPGVSIAQLLFMDTQLASVETRNQNNNVSENTLMYLKTRYISFRKDLGFSYLNPITTLDHWMKRKHKASLYLPSRLILPLATWHFIFQKGACCEALWTLCTLRSKNCNKRWINHLLYNR